MQCFANETPFTCSCHGSPATGQRSVGTCEISVLHPLISPSVFMSLKGPQNKKGYGHFKRITFPVNRALAFGSFPLVSHLNMTGRPSSQAMRLPKGKSARPACPRTLVMRRRHLRRHHHPHRWSHLSVLTSPAGVAASAGAPASRPRSHPGPRGPAARMPSDAAKAGAAARRRVGGKRGASRPSLACPRLGSPGRGASPGWCGGPARRAA